MQCPFRESIFFKDILSKFIEHVRVGCPWDISSFSTEYTGVTPHVMLLVEMERTKHKFEVMIVIIKDDMKTLFDEKIISVNEYHTNIILK